MSQERPHTPELSDSLTAEQIEQWMEGARDPNGHPGWHPATNRDIHDLCELALRALASETPYRMCQYAKDVGMPEYSCVGGECQYAKENK